MKTALSENTIVKRLIRGKWEYYRLVMCDKEMGYTGVGDSVVPAGTTIHVVVFKKNELISKRSYQLKKDLGFKPSPPKLPDYGPNYLKFPGMVAGTAVIDGHEILISGRRGGEYMTSVMGGGFSWTWMENDPRDDGFHPVQVKELDPEKRDHFMQWAQAALEAFHKDVRQSPFRCFVCEPIRDRLEER